MTNRAATGRNGSLLLLLVVTAVTASAAGPDTKYKAPHNEYGQPDLRGVWNFSSDVPLERPASADGKNVWSREELEAYKAAKVKTFEMISKVAPVEAVALTWLDYTGRIENLRTSLITYPETGKVPKLVEGARRVPGPDELFAALTDAKGAPPLELLSSIVAGGSKDGPEDFSPSERCLFAGATPLTPGFDDNYVQIIQAKDHVVLRTEHQTKIVPLDGRPFVSEKLRSWSGDSRGRWDGDSLVIETRNFNRRTRSFAGAGNSLDKVVTERLTRVSKNALEYEATIVDPKTFQDKVVIALPMAAVDAQIYEYACHEGNYSLPMTLAGARKEEQAAMKAAP
jgi:hypothetical protein